MRIRFGVDIGGTDIKIGMFSEECHLIEKWSVRTDLSEQGRHIIPDVAAGIREHIRQLGIDSADVIGIGMGIPGPVDPHGYVKKCVNLNWNEFDPVAELRAYFPDCIVAAGNDANVAALGEYHQGGGAGSSSMMMVTLGTGVGGGVIIDGKIIIGAHGIAGEIGHIAMNHEETQTCNCGNRGCVDQCASATGIVRYARQMMEASDQPSSMRSIENLTSKDVCSCAKAGDALAFRCIETCMEPLGAGLACFSHAFDPEVYVIGGGVSNAGDLIVKAVRKSYRKHMYLAEGADIRLATLGNDAGMIGACMLTVKG